MSIDGIVVREITTLDAEAVADLSGQLGYPVSPDEMGRRIEALTRSGPADVNPADHRCGEAGDENRMTAGIGRCLLIHAERWGRERGLTSVVVRSQIARERAHRFYLREGYAHAKTSAVFKKKLS